MAVRRFGRPGRFGVAGLVAVGAVVALAGGAVAAVPIQKVSADPYTNTSSFHRTQVEPDTFSFGSTIVATFQTGRFSDGGASNTCWATSRDNGATWTHGCLPGTTIYADPPGSWARISDPAVAYDPEHDVWMITGLAINSQVVGKAVLVSRSTDGGLTWGNPVTVASGGSFFDKEWITCDTWSGSPFYGNCYVEWDDAGLGGLFLMSRSTDGGQTWTSSNVPNDSVIAGQPVVQPDGDVIVPIIGSGIDSYVSSDGGANYSGPFNVASQTVHLVAGNVRVNYLPSAEVDGSGKIFVAWEDCRFRAGCSSNDVLFATSSDGQTWSSPTRIPIDPTSSTVDHFVPGIAVDKTTSGATALVGVTYYFYPQANCTVDTCRLEAGFVKSSDGGGTWTAPVTVLGPMHIKGMPLTTQGYMFGDYISTSFGGNGRAYPVIPRDKGSTCQLGQITSCNQFMIAPVGGLRPDAPLTPVARDPVLVKGPAHLAPRPLTVF
jgi:hypothetical protein